MYDLIIDAQRKRNKGTGLNEFAISQLSLADILEEDFIEMIEAIRRRNGGNVDLLSTVINAVFAIDLSTADPGNEPNRESDDVVQLVLLLNLMNLSNKFWSVGIREKKLVRRYMYASSIKRTSIMLLYCTHHPVESGLAINGADEHLLFASVDERGKLLESVSVLVDWHAQEDDIGVRNDVLVVVAQGVDIAVEFLFVIYRVVEIWEVVSKENPLRRRLEHMQFGCELSNLILYKSTIHILLLTFKTSCFMFWTSHLTVRSHLCGLRDRRLTV